MLETIFYLEGRGGRYLYHFFIYNLGGLYYILNKNYNNRGKYNTSVLLQNKSKIVNKPSENVNFPIKIYMQNISEFQRETFELIKDKFILLDKLPSDDNYEIVSIYGETLNNNPYLDNKEIPIFLRKLFRESILKFSNLNYNSKRIFITRKNSEKYHSGTLKRYILNETEIIDKLKKYNFEFIQLEDYNIEDKIKLFMEADIVLSSHSGGLVFSLFCNDNTKIIEILNKGTNGFLHDHYSNLCNIVNISYYRYSNINEDINGNFNLNFNDFEPFLLNIIKN